MMYHYNKTAIMAQNKFSLCQNGRFAKDYVLSGLIYDANWHDFCHVSLFFTLIINLKAFCPGCRFSFIKFS